MSYADSNIQTMSPKEGPIPEMELSEQAISIIQKMQKPASKCDRPGDWGADPIIEKYGIEAVNELVASGLVQRGGEPSPVPSAVAAMYPKHMEEHFHAVASCKSRGEDLYHQYGKHCLFLTEAGWTVAMALDASTHQTM